YFTSVSGMSKQLSRLLKGAADVNKSSSSSGNLVITGPRGNGKTTLAIDVVKALQKEKRIEGRKLAKVSGKKLNSKDI
ncbi:MAG: AAA family ATPase, partial [Lachnospiraceae bacterium]|nr:AAA family ATPase [Lachnospiraceae bacterium]